jgi:hypothetical protein
VLAIITISEEDKSFGKSENNYIKVGLDYFTGLGFHNPTYKNLPEENLRLKRGIKEIYESDS